MKEKALEFLKCPKTSGRLYVQELTQKDGDELLDGILRNDFGDTYLLKDGIPDLITPEDLVGDALFARNYYKSIASTYDANVDITFQLYNENEQDARNYMIDLLNLRPHDRILEISAGTGKDSELILKRMSSSGELVCLDVSTDMLHFAKQKLSKFNNYTEAIGGSACNLPFEDNSFDALYCFAGVGHFPSLAKGLAEMARVVRKGGKVVFCEKHVPEWLRNTTYGKILINNNPMFAYDDPLKHIPIEARNLGIRWIIGNVHYVVDYEVGDGEPVGNFDLELPGERGGTFNTRYFGRLEGVTNETKQLALQAQKLTGKSMHAWIDDLIKKESTKLLNEKL